MPFTESSRTGKTYQWSQKLKQWLTMREGS